MVVVNDKGELMKSEIDKNSSLQVKLETIQLDEKDKTNSDQQEKSALITNKKLSNEYILREGYEREWIERIKILMERQHKKPLEQKLAELMPLVRYHQDIKNAIKAKRSAIQQQLNIESVNEFLNRLSELYGRNSSDTFHRKINRKIKCNKCKKRGHLRRNCKENRKSCLRKNSGEELVRLAES